MAILKTIKLESGITAENSYHKVSSTEALSNGQLRYTVLSYIDSDKSLPAFSSVRYTAKYDLEGGNIFEQAYADMKENNFSEGENV